MALMTCSLSIKGPGVMYPITSRQVIDAGACSRMAQTAWRAWVTSRRGWINSLPRRWPTV